MGVIKKDIKTIPLTEFTNADELFFRQIQMKGDKVLKKYKAQYEETKKRVYSTVTARGIIASYKIDALQQDSIRLEDGTVISSKMLSRVFQKSEEVAVYAVTLNNYDCLEQEEEDFMKTFFYDGWGTALAECASAWLKIQTKGELEKQQLYSTCSWSPGQHQVDIKLQWILFELLHPEEIDIILNDSCMMHPKKSVSGFFGIGPDPDMEQIRACDFCERRETCPSAYSDQM